ncbi:MAG TPA: hypothetical protein VF794_37745 [Archangium sp.]|uniref:hypothetical protein n=1 Tax=Archangium sp. TaxID=1872627 RepID=UPI002ED8709B
MRDADGDGVASGEARSACVGTDLTGYSSTKDADDCDNANPKAWVLHPVYLDADVDGAGDGERVLRCGGQTPPVGTYASATDCAPSDGWRWRMLPYAHRACIGKERPVGYSIYGFDSNDSDAKVTESTEDAELLEQLIAW